MGVLFNITAKYSKIEALLYDSLIAPAVAADFIQRFDVITGNSFSRLPTHARVLDVGCGGGQISISLAERFGKMIFTGIDLSEDQIFREKRRSETIRNVGFEVGNALDMPFNDCSFEAVISIACLKHWPDKQKGLRECCRVLKPGGVLLVAEADRGCNDDAALGFASKWKIPRLAKHLGASIFRRFVAGRSVTVDDVNFYAKDLDLEGTNVKSLRDVPVIVLTGQKSH